MGYDCVAEKCYAAVVAGEEVGRDYAVVHSVSCEVWGESLVVWRGGEEREGREDFCVGLGVEVIPVLAEAGGFVGQRGGQPQV